MLAAGLTLAGHLHERNDDAFAIVCPDDPARRERKGALFAVADGVGGYRAGAAALAGLVEAYYAPASPARIEPALGWAVQAANLRVLDLAAHTSAQREMQTTLSCLVVADDRAYLAHTGDNRIFLARDGTLRQLTTDHVEAAELVRPGLVKSEASHSQRVLPARTLGVNSRLRPDFARHPIAPGDIFLLCNQALWSAVTDGELLLAASAAVSPDAICRRVLGLLSHRASSDRATALVVRVQDSQTGVTPDCAANSWQCSPVAASEATGVATAPR